MIDSWFWNSIISLRLHEVLMMFRTDTFFSCYCNFCTAACYFISNLLLHLTSNSARDASQRTGLPRPLSLCACVCGKPRCESWPLFHSWWQSEQSQCQEGEDERGIETRGKATTRKMWRRRWSKCLSKRTNKQTHTQKKMWIILCYVGCFCLTGFSLFLPRAKLLFKDQSVLVCLLWRGEMRARVKMHVRPRHWFAVKSFCRESHEKFLRICLCALLFFIFTINLIVFFFSIRILCSFKLISLSGLLLLL